MQLKELGELCSICTGEDDNGQPRNGIGQADRAHSRLSADRPGPRQSGIHCCEGGRMHCGAVYDISQQKCHQ